MTHYRTLGLTSMKATQKEIKEHFYSRSLKCHPDMNPTEDAAIKFLELTKAYHVLRDPHTRKLYDASLVRFATVATVATSASSTAAADPNTTGYYTWSSSRQWPGTSDERYEAQFGSRKGFRQRRSNYAVLLGVCALGVVGAAIQFLRSVWASEFVKETHDRRDSMARASLNDVRRQAAENGFDKQLDILRDHAKKINNPNK
jgi:hypothetical protein